MTKETNIEVAKLATQLTISIMNDRNGQMMSIIHASRRDGASKDSPDAMVVFDSFYSHIQELLNEQ
jgi:hypothetical protein